MLATKSEQQFQGKLDLPRAVCQSADDAKVAAVNLSIGVAKLCAVEGVEELYTQLSIPFAIMKVIVLKE